MPHRQSSTQQSTGSLRWRKTDSIAVRACTRTAISTSPACRRRQINNQEGQVTPSAAVTATLPVQGVPGLTVTVTIPALYGMKTGTTAAYSVNGGTLTAEWFAEVQHGNRTHSQLQSADCGDGPEHGDERAIPILVHAASGRATERDTILSHHGAGLHRGFVHPADAEPADGWAAWYFVPKRLSSVCGRRILEHRVLEHPGAIELRAGSSEGSTDKWPATMAAGRSSLRGHGWSGRRRMAGPVGARP